MSRQSDSDEYSMISCGVYEDRTGSVESVPLLLEALPRYPAWFLLTVLCQFNREIPACDLSQRKLMHDG